jgi:acetyltransferase-like isoleucine patch superfamily enzyme
MIRSVIEKIKFDYSSDRIGPDCIFTYWKLFFKDVATKFCASKLSYFGDGAEIRPGSYLINCSSISIGKRVVIRPSTMLFGDKRINNSIVLEDDVMLGSGVHIYVSNHTFTDPSISIIDQGHDDVQPVLVKKGAWIGANAIILPGVIIGSNSVVGAGSVVTKNVEDRVVVVGNPAKFVKSIVG